MKDTKKRTQAFSNLILMLIRQSIAAFVCFALIYGMYTADNTKLNKYAKSIGTALRYDADFSSYAKSAANRIKDILTPDNPLSETEGITFQ